MQLRTLTLRGIPEPVLKALRAGARRNRRSLNAEVLVRLEAGVGHHAAAGGRPGNPRRGAGGPAGDHEPAVVREPTAPPYEVRRAFEEADASRLRSDLALTPEQRVHLAEEIGRTSAGSRPRPRFQRVIQFERYEDYLEWQRHGERAS